MEKKLFDMQAMLAVQLQDSHFKYSKQFNQFK